MALGATPSSVQSLIFQQGFLTVCIGLAMGFGLAVPLMRVLRGEIAGLGTGNTADMWLAA
jgi:hypothetical protein